jgi:diguanylate cyclase (GGDEF)-like protein
MAGGHHGRESNADIRRRGCREAVAPFATKSCWRFVQYRGRLLLLLDEAGFGFAIFQIDKTRRVILYPLGKENATDQLITMLGRYFLLACLLMASIAWAADPQGSYSFRGYGPDQGLRNQAVTSLAQDAAGYIYVGTEDGLFRYDGERFVRLGSDEGLPSDSITLLHATRRGQLMVVTQKGLLAWNVAAPGGKVLLADQEVLGVASSDTGRLLVSTTTGSYEGDMHVLARLPDIPAKPGAGWLSRDGSELLLAVDGSLYQRDATAHWRTRKLPQAAGESVQSLLRDARGRIWVRGRQLLLRLANFDAPVENLSAELPGAAVQKGELVEDAAGRIWAPTNAGVAMFEGDHRTLIDLARGLPHEWATTVLVDREGNLWVASEGVHRLQGRLAWTAFSSRQGLPSDTVWAIHRDHAGALWAATNRGIAKASAQGWTVFPGTEDRSFYSFAEDADGNLWIGGNSGKLGSNTLLLRARGSERFIRVPLASAKGPSTVNSLAIGADGALYVATMAHGLHRLLREGSTFKSEAVALPGGTSNEQINQLSLDARGRLWAAGMRGLAVHDDHGWRRLRMADGLSENEIETITPDAGDGMWVSYWNLHGLTRVRVDASGRTSATHITAPPALVEDTIYSVGMDSQRGFWFGTALGIKRWRAPTIERFSRADGLPGDDAAANAFLADTNGDLWFGMANGLAHFDASRDVGVVKPPIALVSSLQDGKGVELVAATARVPWQRRTLTFQSAVLSFVDENRIKRQLRLIGFEDAWRDTDVSEARYTGLLPGQYRFQVRARFGAGKFGPVASRSVVILPPWWLTWWFLSLALIAGVLLSLLVHRWQLRRLRLKNQALEALITARTQDLQVANAALEEASMVDPLTGLKNRRYLKAFIPEELALAIRQQRTQSRLAVGVQARNIDLCVMLVDLDHFKSVNDIHGHGAGDAVLRQVGEVLRAACRASDVVVRWGGEEFLILARNSDRHQAKVLATQVCAAVRAHAFDLGNGEVLHKTCSLGFTAFPLLPAQPEKFDWEQAVELADQCLYAAKKSGRDAWVGCLLLGDTPPDSGLLQGEVRKIDGYCLGLVLSSFPEGHPIEWNAPSAG